MAAVHHAVPNIALPASKLKEPCFDVAAKGDPPAGFGGDDDEAPEVPLPPVRPAKLCAATPELWPRLKPAAVLGLRLA